ncbi:TRAP transporter large permease [Chromohalobacter canadensis]|uniref:TRAP transporter large permease n=1 Tax=Chromohalobacter canadensis TaxID=141389 RepID=UPI0021BDFEDF|nr:TRAP transporter large permease [Chromohalobacter canadensis]MCT8468101.1 TRAP transporter large permease [Chromohalobacter canadensis]MCT8498609.1 TRAP transporter large permease [Chromohalobacter canadensis]
MAVGIALAALLLLFVLGTPVAFALFLSTFVYFLFGADQPTMLLIQRLAGGLESISLLAIPFFIMAGVFMNYSGITDRLLKLAELMTRRMHGGLAQANVLLSTFMGGLSGSNIADAAMNAKLLVPSMTTSGYPKPFSTAVTAASSLVTSTIPPGIALIVYGYVNNVSIGRLFLAGVVPGVLMAVCMMLLVSRQCRRLGYQPPRKERVSRREWISVTRAGIIALLLPVVVIGGIRVGVFTPTEAGAMAVLYALIVGMFVYKEMNIGNVAVATRESLFASVNVLFIIAVASGFARFLTWEHIPQDIAMLLSSEVGSAVAFLLLANFLLLTLGMFLEGNAILIVLSPLLAPVAAQFGIDPVHFGIIFILNASIGTITPPLGTVMFTTCSITGVRVPDFIRAIMPYWLLLVGILLIVTFVPAVSMTLPNLIF